eukprot:471246-Prorocentrum_minimum.AAC.1
MARMAEGGEAGGALSPEAVANWLSKLGDEFVFGAQVSLIISHQDVKGAQEDVKGAQEDIKGLL